jgi:tRNA(Ser,Leu) C12 N-acetylase TAN1
MSDTNENTTSPLSLSEQAALMDSAIAAKVTFDAAEAAYLAGSQSTLEALFNARGNKPFRRNGVEARVIKGVRKATGTTSYSLRRLGSPDVEDMG